MFKKPLSTRQQNERAGIPSSLDSLLSFSKIRIIIPRIKILKLFYIPRKLTEVEFLRLNVIRGEIQKKILKLQHALSVVDRVLEKYK